MLPKYQTLVNFFWLWTPGVVESYPESCLRYSRAPCIIRSVEFCMSWWSANLSVSISDSSRDDQEPPDISQFYHWRIISRSGGSAARSAVPGKDTYPKYLIRWIEGSWEVLGHMYRLWPRVPVLSDRPKMASGCCLWVWGEAICSGYSREPT